MWNAFFQISEVQVQVTQNTEALQGARTEVNELRRQIQTLEIELESQKNLVSCDQISNLKTTCSVNGRLFIDNVSFCRKDHWKPLSVT